MSIEVRGFRVGEPAWDDFLRIAFRAYFFFYGEDTPQARERVTARMRIGDTMTPTAFYGAYSDGCMVGGMRLFDFIMRVRGADVAAGGLGFVAVDLAHKQRGVARALVQFYFDHYRRRGTAYAVLHPFRPDFYGSLGFGYGTKMSLYRMDPRGLPAGGDRDSVRLMNSRDTDALIACYERVRAQSNGLIAKYRPVVERSLDLPDRYTAGTFEGDDCHGYLTFEMQQARAHAFGANELVIEELIYESPAALASLLAFLRTQADQFPTVVFCRQDDAMHFLPHDPRDGTQNTLVHPGCHQSNTQGVGVMYRTIDVPGAVQALAGTAGFGLGEFAVGFEVRDAFLEPHDHSLVLAFRDGVAVPYDGAPDARITLDVAAFSSLLLGSVSLRALYDFGRATLSHPSRLAFLDRLLAADTPPRCVTPF